jgi:hypothetical protein
LFENVAARTFEIDEDDVGIDRPDPVKQLSRVVDPHDARVPGPAQAILDDGARNGFLSMTAMRRSRLNEAPWVSWTLSCTLRARA